MNLTKITDSNLIANTETLAREERGLLTKVLHHLREIERRRLYSSLGYKSLFDFATRKLGYSEDQAYRRIAAMRLLSELPDVETSIQSGALSLTHISLAHQHFQREKKHGGQALSAEAKASVLEKIANRPIREAEQITLSLSTMPNAPSPDQIKIVADDRIEFRFQANSRVRGKVEHLKGLLAHKRPSLNLGELFEILCEIGIKQLSPAVPLPPRKRRVIKISKAQMRRTVFKRAGNQCERCGSTYSLEVDHIKPQAKGGATTLDNLRVLCRSCNQRHAISELGLEKMDQYLNS